MIEQTRAMMHTPIRKTVIPKMPMGSRLDDRLKLVGSRKGIFDNLIHYSLPNAAS